MANDHTNLSARHSDGHHLQLTHTTTDSPILPVADLERLHQLNPDLVNWVTTQTELEAQHRRNETRRVNTFVFIERISGVIAGATVAIVGLLIAAYTAIQGHSGVALGIGGATLASIVSVLVVRQRTQVPEEDENSERTESAS